MAARSVFHAYETQMPSYLGNAHPRYAVIEHVTFSFGAGGWDAEASAYAPITPTASLARPSASYHTLGRRENDSTSP